VQLTIKDKILKGFKKDDLKENLWFSALIVNYKLLIYINKLIMT
jgi:hypothetical protein